jgi:hypothetical protein
MCWRRLGRETRTPEYILGLGDRRSGVDHEAEGVRAPAIRPLVAQKQIWQYRSPAVRDSLRSSATRLRSVLMRAIASSAACSGPGPSVTTGWMVLAQTRSRFTSRCGGSPEAPSTTCDWRNRLESAQSCGDPLLRSHRPKGRPIAIRRNAGAARCSGTSSVQDQDFHAAVGAPPFRRCVGGDRACVAHPLGGQPVCRELEVVDEDLLDPLGPAL